jgi:hypothetical protein
LVLHQPLFFQAQVQHLVAIVTEPLYHRHNHLRIHFFQGAVRLLVLLVLVLVLVE